MPGPVAAIAGSAIVGAGASLFGSSQASKSADKAAKQQKKAAKIAAAQQKAALERQIGLQEPFRQVGVNALAQYPKAAEYTPFGMPQFQADPGYNFRMAEGMKALERSAAARGLLQSGGTLKGIQQYGQNLASEEYQNAFNRYQLERQSRLSPLQSLAGVGQTSVQQLGGQAGQLGQNLGNLAMTGAATQGQAGLAAANVRASQYGGMGSALGTALNAPQTQNYLASLFGGPGMGQSSFAQGYTPANYG